jgi:hypothetical protein
MSLCLQGSGVLTLTAEMPELPMSGPPGFSKQFELFELFNINTSASPTQSSTAASNRFDPSCRYFTAQAPNRRAMAKRSQSAPASQSPETERPSKRKRSRSGSDPDAEHERHDHESWTSADAEGETDGDNTGPVGVGSSLEPLKQHPVGDGASWPQRAPMLPPGGPATETLTTTTQPWSPP